MVTIAAAVNSFHDSQGFLHSIRCLNEFWVISEIDTDSIQDWFTLPPCKKTG